MSKAYYYAYPRYVYTVTGHPAQMSSYYGPPIPPPPGGDPFASFKVRVISSRV